MTTQSPPVLSLDAVSRRFGSTVAVDGVSLAVAPGEFFSLLGPSGCGKTTTLRLIAGFEHPDAGRVQMLGEDVTSRRPYERPIGMVFQSYAIFPHLSVAGNVAFGLEERRVPKGEVAGRVARALELVRLAPSEFAHRRPAELSGGQRQRVALARALVLEPPILLLDEPLAALDLQLRKEMQLELKALNRRLGITFILVTHDQEEALVMSDRIAVMHAGRVEQLGTPAEIYEAPRTAFVAEFIGEANFFAGAVEEGDTVRQQDGFTWRLPAGARVRGEGVRIAVRPEWLDVHRPGESPAGENVLRGTVRETIFLGETLHVLVVLGDGQVVRVALRNEGLLTKPLPWAAGEAVEVAWHPDDAQVLEA
ncbi:MAG: ABC transporter ATP-binding protein [Gemmatimonadetes bacterium]|nr:ABC transporter ATP-binding protein [Gemmatimonadota bacterium]MBL0178482.1 ABC transporter ATP-binding protein [Gemmatimonadota bacterium]